ncbi:MAG TPA: OmpA family protein [Polyangia bacterium]|jgi:outer membrane protein OmpA-like peptidoglycan-associated protein|nr:OmpA family protein [Polyangia bacterium]
MLRPVMPPVLRPLLVATMLLLAAAAAPATAAKSKAGKPSKAGGDVVAGSRLKIQVEKARVDLENHRLEVKMWPRSGKVTMEVTGESGAVIAEEAQDFTGRPAGSPLPMSWHPSNAEPVARIEIRATYEDGYIGVALMPWSVSVPHDEVNFKTGSAVIEDSEVPKLEAAHARIVEKVATIRARDINKDHPNLTLFIAGHTDTVGGNDYNLGLSRDRARAIAAWLRRRGVGVPIAYEGFGETSPAVPTADQVDEPRNRRVDYVLSFDEPTMKTTGYRPTWKRSN